MSVKIDRRIIENEWLWFDLEMRNLVRKCKGIGEVSVAKVTADDDQGGGVMTRARALAMAAAGMDRKRRKLVGSGRELQFTSTTSYVQIPTRRSVVITTAKKMDVSVSVLASPLVVSENSSSSSSSQQLSSSNLPCEDSCSSPNSDVQILGSSRCSSNGSREFALDNKLRSGSDLEYEGFDSACIPDCRESRETTPSSELREESDDDLESRRKPTPPEANSRRRTTAEKTPSEAELDEFFSAAEKAEKKRFAEKYNFDVVKDVPLEGRYEWVRLKQP